MGVQGEKEAKQRRDGGCPWWSLRAFQPLIGYQYSPRPPAATPPYPARLLFLIKSYCLLKLLFLPDSYLLPESQPLLESHPLPRLASLLHIHLNPLPLNSHTPPPSSSRTPYLDLQLLLGSQPLHVSHPLLNPHPLLHPPTPAQLTSPSWRTPTSLFGCAGRVGPGEQRQAAQQVLPVLAQRAAQRHGAVARGRVASARLHHPRHRHAARRLLQLRGEMAGLAPAVQQLAPAVQQGMVGN